MLTVVVISYSVSAHAQEVVVSFAAYAPFEVNDLTGLLPRMADVRVSIPAAERIAVEPFVAVGPERGPAGTEGLAGLQIRHRFAMTANSQSQGFGTYGLAAIFTSNHGSSSPVFGLFGVGFQRRISTRAALRSDVQVVTYHVIPIGVRFLAGLSMRVGG